jgi:WXG100 family type VII secretion target
MTGTLLVDPSVLSAKSASFASQATQVKALHDDMLSRVSALSAAWEGTAADAYRAKFNALQASMDKIYTTIMEHSTDLTAMAEEYETAESQAASEAEALPTSNF